MVIYTSIQKLTLSVACRPTYIYLVDIEISHDKEIGYG